MRAGCAGGGPRSAIVEPVEAGAVPTALGLCYGREPGGFMVFPRIKLLEVRPFDLIGDPESRPGRAARTSSDSAPQLAASGHRES